MAGPWRLPLAVYDPGKVLLDVATAVALGGDCLANVAAVWAQPELFGRVASDPTVSRVIASLAADIDTVLPGRAWDEWPVQEPMPGGASCWGSGARDSITLLLPSGNSRESP